MARNATARRRKRRSKKSPMVDLARIRKALRLLDRLENGRGADPEAAIALKLYRMCKKFFAQGGRFKRPYKRKKRSLDPQERMRKHPLFFIP